MTKFKSLQIELDGIQVVKRLGQIASVGGSTFRIEGLSLHANVGDQIIIRKGDKSTITGEIVSLEKGLAFALAHSSSDGTAIGNTVELVPGNDIFPAQSWIGRIVDAFGNPLDGRPLLFGDERTPLRRAPPKAANRRPLGPRLNTTLAVFNTVLPIARGQRIGIFAGSGVGKSFLLAELARGIDCDIAVIALIGERGRELNNFVEKVLGEKGMRRAIIISATSDQSPLIKRRAAWTATAVAEYFRDRGNHVLLLMDSITRFAEAHREIALSAGETPSLRAFPPSTANYIANLAERSGPGPKGAGDITAIYTVLVAGSDMEEPIADITRGVLDGHIVLSREIAESGRFPAIDIMKSVSRSLPEIATDNENQAIANIRKYLSLFEKTAPMIHTGLYESGTDSEIDHAISIRPSLDQFFKRKKDETAEQSFANLNEQDLF